MCDKIFCMEDKDVTWTHIRRRLGWILLIPAGALLPHLCAGHRAFFERYATEFYPPVKDLISSITSLVPISIAEAVLYALVIGIPLLILTRLLAAIFGRINWKGFWNMIVSLLIAAGIVWNLFYVTWGFNYFREPLRNRMELSAEPASTDELKALSLEFAEKASEVRALVPEDADGVFCVEGGAAGLFHLLTGAYGALAEEYPVFSGKVTPAKPVSWSEGLSWAGISGVYVGLTAEPNVNVDQPPLLMLQGAGHEMAHQLGLASENEAEFAGILACLCSDRPEIVYSGLMCGLFQCQNALLSADRKAWLEVWEHYSEGMKRDIDAYNAYWDRYEGPVEETVTETNDSYLKHNSQESGVKSYGESVDLLLALRKTKNILDCIKIF